MDYSSKLARLKDRRQGYYTRDGVFNFTEARASIPKVEQYSTLKEPEAVKYAIGSMQAVDNDYTNICYAEAARISSWLQHDLPTIHGPVTFEFQGSVPLDVHVRGNSDVDLLVMAKNYLSVARDLKQAYPNAYVDLPGKTLNQWLAELRRGCIQVISHHFPTAKVDSTSAKAIPVSGGSLRRDIDVIPAHWHDTLAWKRTGTIKHREIFVYDWKQQLRIHNMPFMHIALIREKCDEVSGSLRKIIRLLKNLRYDADSKIDFSSYDIASLAWHMPAEQLRVPFSVDLLLVERARSFLRAIVDDQRMSEMLMVPNGSRRIFDEPAKFDAAKALHGEVDKLAQDIVKEVSPYATHLGQTRSQVLSKSIRLHG